MEYKSCAFTGHRPHKFPWKYDEADSRCLALKTALREQIVCLADVEITNFYSGMAEGTDIWAAEIVLELCDKGYPLQLHCVLPCKGQADRWSEAARQRYCNILAQANSSEYVSREYRKDCRSSRNLKGGYYGSCFV